MREKTAEWILQNAVEDRNAMIKSATSRSVIAILLLLAPPAFSEDGRPSKHPDYQKGYRAFGNKDWDKAADYMLKAENNWQEDGIPTNTYGIWFEPYLPRYYLGIALFELGCCNEAMKYLESSLLGKQSIRDTEAKLERLQSVQRKCARRLELGVEEPTSIDCSRWNVNESGASEHNSSSSDSDQESPPAINKDSR